ncbi:MAG: DeoR/GlpR transcriptional regulator [Armatimonadetes bacterium]|nr:DeoR/GlpR transcriptional regulator [Armatimonadota bacterium]
METLFVPERWDRIADLLNTQGRATVEELADLLSVSTATIRRDLRHMQRRGIITRTRGGAVKSQQVGLDRSIDESRALYVAEKEKIGSLAASLIEPGDTVIIDGGSTTFQVARNITVSGVTVVTNALDIVSALMPKHDIEVVVIGGMLRRYGGTTIGPTTERELSHLMADKAIIGINAISVSHGLSTPNPLVAEVKQVMIKQSREVIVVVDHTKFGEVALYEVAPIDAVDKIVTDSGISEDQVRHFLEAGVEVMIAE